MENEDIFSNIWIVIIAIVSIIIRVIGSSARQKQEQEAPAAPTTSYDEEEEVTTHSDSLETIFDEIFEGHKRAEVTHTAAPIAEAQPQNVSTPQNATNRTSARSSRTVATEPTTNKNSSNRSKKNFNLREAVIYSEILTPKFKDGE